MTRDRNKLSLEDRIRREEDLIKTRSKALSHLSATLLAIIFVLVAFQFEFDAMKGWIVDGLFRLRGPVASNDAIKLIAYDDLSSQRYDGSLKLPAEEIAQVLRFLESEKPKAVGVISAVNDKLYSEAELKLIARALKRLPQAFIGYTDDDSFGRVAPAPLENARYLPGYISRDSFSYGADSVTRRVMITIDGLPTLYSYLAALYREVDPGEAFYRHTERFGDSAQTYINWQGPAGTYESVPSQAVAEYTVPKGTFTGKVVLLGTALNAKKGADHILSPYSREPYRTTLLEGAAESLATLLDDDGLAKTPAGVHLLISLFIGILTVNMVLFLSPAKGILFVMGELLFLFAYGWILLNYRDRWANLAHPLAVACVGYYLVIPYRLVNEYRKRWHYQEKSELMAQLETLKSNFLSLISHDLKTPIARIQGNAELMLNEGGALSEKQAKSLNAIVHTTEDLGKYVETVLDLTRIESAKVPLKVSTKDINATILDVLEEKQPLAQERNITLVTELEPLFSFKFDVKLIRQVLANLVENAIKYSPSDSVITLHSREEGSWIRVSVVDSGIGIPPEEQSKVFGKFYRCENDDTKTVKGTGLGLYLVKYFVELHQGVVSLKSELGKGSSFTVSLPV